MTDPTTAYEEGFAAHYEAACPYMPFSEAAIAWELGWHDRWKEAATTVRRMMKR
jgi:hypothetical protein